MVILNSVGKMKKLTDKEVKRVASLKKLRTRLEKKKAQIELELKPTLDRLEEIRHKIDEIEL